MNKEDLVESKTALQELAYTSRMNAIVAASSSIGLAIGAVSFMAERSYVQGSMFGVASTVLGGLCASEIMRARSLMQVRLLMRQRF
jgi:hypothetical protein